MELVILIAAGVVIGVAFLSAVLFLAFRKREETFTSISQQAEAIESSGKKKKAPKPPYRPWANRPKKGNTPQGSPKVDRSEKVPEEATPDPPSPPKDEPAKKKAPISAAAPSEQDKKKKEQGRADEQEERKQGAREPKQPSPKKERVQEKKEADKAALSPLVSQQSHPSPKEPKQQSTRGEETDVGSTGKPKTKPKTSGKRGSFLQVRDLLENTAMQEDEIHVLIETLLAKREDSEAWQEAGGKVSSGQQLRRQLDDITAKYMDALQSSDVLAASVKKLRGELNTEASRRQQQETNSQAQVSRLNKDIHNLKQRLSSQQEELDKARREAQQQQQQQPQEAGPSGDQLVLKGMQEEIGRLQSSLTESNQKNHQLESEVQGLTASLQEARAKESELSAVKDTPSQAAAAKQEVSQLKGLLATKDKELTEQAERMQKELDQSREEQERLSSDVNAHKFTMQSLETQLAKLTASAASSGAQEERLRQAEAQSAKLEKEKESFLAEHQSKEKELQGLRDASQKLQNEMECERREAEGKEEERARLADQVFQLEQQLEMAKASSTSPDVTRIKELEDCNTQLAADAAHAKEQVTQLEEQLRLKEVPVMQQAQDQQDGNTVPKELHQQQLASKEEEVEQLSEKVAELKKEKTSLEQRLTEMKQKNSELYNKSWKISDQAEETERKAQQEVRMAQRKAEERLVAAVREQSVKEEERTKAILQDLLPDVEVEEGKDYEEWLEGFVQEVSKNSSVTNGPSTPSPDSSVAEMEAALKEKEASEVELKQKVTSLTGALQRTSDSLTALQSQVESKIKDVTKELEDTKSLLAQERKANQSLCQELAAERENVAKADDQLAQGASMSGAQQEVEDRLKDSTAKTEELNAKLQQMEERQEKLVIENSKLKSKIAELLKAPPSPLDNPPGSETEV